MVGIPVMVVATLDDPAITVDFMFDAEISVAADGIDFTIENDPMTLSFPNGWGYDTIWVTPVDNDEFGGNLTFVVRLTANSLNYNFGAQDSIICTIVDNEHPLSAWIGTYTVAALSYGSPGAWDEEWTVQTYPDADDVTILWFSGIAGGDIDIPGVLDTEAGTISFTAGLDVGDAYGYGATGMYLANTDMIDLAGNYITEDIINACSASNLEGTIDPDGSIHIDNVGLVLEDLVYCWDVFDTYWTKAAKSYRQEGEVIVPNKFNR